MKLQGTLEKSGYQVTYGQALLKLSTLTTGAQKTLKAHQPATSTKNKIDLRFLHPFLKSFCCFDWPGKQAFKLG